jgi:hypothetical protein
MAELNLAEISEVLENGGVATSSGPFGSSSNRVLALVIIGAVARPADPTNDRSACVEFTVSDPATGATGTCRAYEFAIREWYPVLLTYLPKGSGKPSFSAVVKYLFENKVPVRFYIKNGGFASKPNYPRRASQ